MRPSTQQVIEILKQKKGESKILDVACGRGKETTHIKKILPEVVIHAFDIENSNSFGDDIVFKKGMIEDVPILFPGEEYDIILCQHIFEHIVYPDASILILRKFLKHDGCIVIESPNWTRLFIPFHRNFFWNDPTHVRPYTKYSLKALCKITGLKPVRITTRSSASFKSCLKAVAKSRNPIQIIKRLISICIDPFLKDNIILIAQKD